MSHTNRLLSVPLFNCIIQHRINWGKHHAGHIHTSNRSFSLIKMWTKHLFTPGFCPLTTNWSICSTKRYWKEDNSTHTRPSTEQKLKEKATWPTSRANGVSKIRTWSKNFILNSRDVKQRSKAHISCCSSTSNSEWLCFSEKQKDL